MAGFPQGCPLSMVFIIALYVPWCRYLSNQHGVTPQLYADNLKCVSSSIEASLLSQSNVLKLRAAFVRACWSSKLTFAHTGTVLGMLDGPDCVDPGTCIVWFRFRMMRRYLAYRPLETDRIARLLEMISNGAPGHGPLYLLVDSAAGLGFRWSRPGLPRLPTVDGPFQHFQEAILGACRL